MNAPQVMKDNVKYTNELARLTGQLPIKVANDLKRDFYLTAAEAVMYGLSDKIMSPAQVQHHAMSTPPLATSAVGNHSPTPLPRRRRQPIKMMQYRGEDDAVVGFGHFSEARRVKSGPSDKVLPIKDDNFDEYAAREMAKKVRPYCVDH